MSGRRFLLGVIGAALLASCAVAGAPPAEITPPPQVSDVMDRHKDHIYRPPSPQ